MQYWILKTEPKTYSFEDLLSEKSTSWDGIRNYQARNNLRSMRVGDECLIYHSVGPKEIVGLASVSKEAYPDPTSSEQAWIAVDINAIKSLTKHIKLAALKIHPKLQNMSLVKQGRLSVCPINQTEFDAIMQLSEN